MTEVTIRIYFSDPNGKVEDGKQDFALSDFGGIVPAAGDVILDPGVRTGRERHDPESRRMWSVVRRVFNPRDNEGDYIALLVEDRRVMDGEQELLP